MVRTRLLVAAVLAVLASLSGAGPALADSSCPAVKTCGAYALEGYSWPHEAGKPVVIPYYVSVALTHPTVPAASLPDVVASAMRVWERADPLIQFKYLGTTQA